MNKLAITGLSLLACVALGRGASAQVDFDAYKQQAVKKSLPLMLSSGTNFQAKMGKVCFSCHHQSLPELAYGTARSHGFSLDESLARRQTDFVYGFVARFRGALDKANAGDAAANRQLDLGLVDPSISVGYALFGLAEDGRQPDATLAAAATYLAKKQREDGSWPVLAARPPLEGSEITCTALAVRALKTYGPADGAGETAQRIARAKDWLVTASPRGTEEQAFRLLGLRWAGAGDEEIRKATAALLAEQRDDGGWAQLPGKSSDAYATGQALVALHRGGGLPTSHAAYSRGTVYLAATQRPDGSWRVAKRTTAMQPYFESGFPHGKDQFISISGTAWATAALALTVEPKQQAAAK